ncbi:MAG: ATP-binding protein, partial [Treponema sp.]|nr:ATP-binding protein [Treponema sp.]
MERRFNYTGTCVPEEHYMVDISPKIAQIREMVDQGLYFTINRARQYGKTTTLSALRRALAGDYLCIDISFESLGDSAFDTEAAFCKVFLLLIQEALEYSRTAVEKRFIRKWYNRRVKDFKALNRHISKMCQKKKIVLMIDEVDASTNFRVYIKFLAMLRDTYLQRKNGKGAAFHSVILAGVYDIKNIKLKMIKEGVYTPHEGESTVYNSPWNIAADFKVDMSFHPEEIATMLAGYEHDHHTGMDIAAVSRELYHWTDGYPFLVSKLCYHIATESQPMGNPLPWPEKPWSKEGIFHAVRLLLWEQNTLFDDLFKNMEYYPDLYDMMYGILILGAQPRYSPHTPVQSRALMFAFIKQDGEYVVISNRIFELLMTTYFMSKDEMRKDRPRRSYVLRE